MPDRLRDWEQNGYTEDGRAVSSVDNKPAPKHTANLPDGWGKDSCRSGGSGDKSRRNK